MVTLETFKHDLEEQRLDDHKYYHQSKWNQLFHLFSAICFLVSEFLIFFNPVLAAYISWFSMIPRQSGHFFFEPKGFDHIHQMTHEHKEAIKVGYNLFRKRLLLSSIFVIAPIVAYFYSETAWEFYNNYGYFMLAISAFAYLARIAYLCYDQSAYVAFVWASKILTDPINDIKIYWKSPIELLQGIRYEEGVQIEA
ncbi:MAG: hypothetical protein SFU98_21325 [Leptospiraceae bacterium]|nr:hypothetical protein [Leptospiraceae bacterium]